MNVQQRLLRTLYPLVMRFSKSKSGNGKILFNDQNARPQVSFYDLKVVLNSGEALEFEQFRNKKVIVVNTASNCGYTGQLSELQQLHDRYRDQVAIVGFPANDFKEQEKGSDQDIAEFCQVNYGVDFPLAKKGSVVKGDQQHPVYQWLTQSGKNGWNDHAPDWNFSKFLVDENGVLTHYFGPAISPLEEEIVKELLSRD